MANSSPVGGAYTSSYAIEVIDAFSKTLDTFAQKMQKTERVMEKAAVKASKAMSLDKIGNRFKEIGRTFSLYVAAPLTGFAAAAIKFGGNVELLESSLGLFIGSAAKTTKVLDDLMDASDFSIYTLENYGDAARLLLGVGESADTVVEKTKRLADVSAAFNLPLDFLAKQYAMSKQTPGSPLDPRTIQILSRQGVPVYKELAKYIKQMTGKTYSESKVKEFFKNGQISAKAFEGVINSMSSKGGIAFGAMQKKTQTLGGSVIVLRNAIEGIFEDVGTSINKTVNISGKMNVLSAGIINFSNSFKGFAEQNPQTVKSLTILVATLITVPPALYAIGTAIKFISAAMMVNPFILGITAIVAAVGLLYENKEKISAFIGEHSGTMNAITTERRNRQDLGARSYSLSDRIENSVQRQQDLSAGSKSEVNMNVNINDKNKNVKSVDATNSGFGKFNLGVNNMMQSY